MTTRPYVGISKGAGKRELFRASVLPTEATHGHIYAAVIGPFRTVRGAQFDVDYGRNNPHVRCVNDAERIAKAGVLPSRAAE